MSAGPDTYVRIPRPLAWHWIPLLVALKHIDLDPPASGPEIELTFGPEATVAYIRAEVERLTGQPILALRLSNVREGDELESRGEGKEPSLTKELLAITGFWMFVSIVLAIAIVLIEAQ